MMIKMEKAIKELKKMEKNGVETLKIYYAEDIHEGSEKWSVDVMQDDLNNSCKMGWTWTVTSLKEFIDEVNDYDKLTYVCNDWEIIVNKPFSDEIICEAINTWLDSNDINIKVEMIDIKDTEGSGYVKKLKERMNS
jgi:hypothetical protein